MVRAAEPPASLRKGTKKAPYICGMETRAGASAQKQPTKETLPKWKLKANWILRQYFRIWCWKDHEYSINFDVAFKDVYTQFFLDNGLLSKDAESCITFAYNEFRLQHGHYPVFRNKDVAKWKWIIKKGMFSFLRERFLSDKTIKKIFYIAWRTEIMLSVAGNPIFDCTKLPSINFDYYLSLPCIPPCGHEWVDDPWARLGK
jgi:hypothetical protein